MAYYRKGGNQNGIIYIIITDDVNIDYSNYSGS